AQVFVLTCAWRIVILQATGHVNVTSHRCMLFISKAALILAKHTTSWRDVPSLCWWCSRVAVYFSTYSVRNFSPPLSWTMTAVSFAATKCGGPPESEQNCPRGSPSALPDRTYLPRRHTKCRRLL